MKKPTLALLSAACLAAMTLTACNNDRNDRDDTVMAGDTAAAADGTDTTMGDDTAMGTGTGTADAMDGTGATNADNASAPAAERSALGVLNAINEHEIAAGKQAQSKGVSGDVAAYAQRMIDEHTRNRDTTSGLGPNADDADAQAQKRKGEEELATLDKKNGDDYAKAYIDAMVKGHTEALSTLDSKLIPAASRPEVRDHLTTTREHVAQHLEQAKALQGK